ncbi:hypothetical protein HDU82_002397 [Entophlyctis luteolus]|nr:hypothetical protein HDU82_002397 [Entophlyctis luteolus]
MSRSSKAPPSARSRLFPRRGMRTPLLLLLTCVAVTVFVVWRSPVAQNSPLPPTAPFAGHSHNSANAFPESPAADDGHAVKLPADIDKRIDYLQAQFLDYLNGEEGMHESDPRFGGKLMNNLSSLFGGSILNLATPFDAKGTWILIFGHAKMLIASGGYNRTDFLYLGRFARANLICYTILYDKKSLQQFLIPDGMYMEQFTRELEYIIQKLTEIVYPWFSPTYSSIFEMQTKFKKSPLRTQNGIIFTTGNWHFELTLHAILTLRKVLKCTLPIEIHYGGPNDLDQEKIDAFKSLPDVTPVNTLDSFTSETSKFGGWSLKPFALLASKFARVIFIDADALFFQDPARLFDPGLTFRKYGQVFFHDRSLFRDDPVLWFKRLNPVWSRYASKLRYMNGLSWHEMESGVVAVDKTRTGALHALMAVCVMNSKEERDGITYSKMHGDKETYWISWDLLRVPYLFVPVYGGTVGFMKPNTTDSVCGGLFHTDENMKPLWWNGGVIANKHHNRDSEFMSFEHAAFDTDGDAIKWDWETETTPFCLKPKYSWEVIELSKEEKNMGQEFVEIYKGIKAIGWRSYLDGLHI